MSGDAAEHRALHHREDAAAGQAAGIPLAVQPGKMTGRVFQYASRSPRRRFPSAPGLGETFQTLVRRYLLSVGSGELPGEFAGRHPLVQVAAGDHTLHAAWPPPCCGPPRTWVCGR
jgi:hypothetical protein